MRHAEPSPGSFWNPASLPLRRNDHAVQTFRGRVAPASLKEVMVDQQNADVAFIPGQSCPGLIEGGWTRNSEPLQSRPFRGGNAPASLTTRCPVFGYVGWNRHQSVRKHRAFQRAGCCASRLTERQISASTQNRKTALQVQFSLAGIESDINVPADVRQFELHRIPVVVMAVLAA